MFVNFYQFTQCCIQEDSSLQCVRFEAVSTAAEDTTLPCYTVTLCCWLQTVPDALSDKGTNIVGNVKITYPMTLCHNSEDLSRIFNLQSIRSLSYKSGQ
jgi:hypothetical protein